MNEARGRIQMTDTEIVERFARFGYRVTIGQIGFTTEVVNDFNDARSKWLRAGRLKTHEPGLLIIEEAQPRPGQPTRDVVVVSLGSSRAVMGIEVKPNGAVIPSGSALRKFAPSMQWVADAKPGRPQPSLQKPANQKESLWSRIRSVNLPSGLRRSFGLSITLVKTSPKAGA